MPHANAPRTIKEIIKYHQRPFQRQSLKDRTSDNGPPLLRTPPNLTMLAQPEIAADLDILHNAKRQMQRYYSHPNAYSGYSGNGVHGHGHGHEHAGLHGQGSVYGAGNDYGLLDSMQYGTMPPPAVHPSISANAQAAFQATIGSSQHRLFTH